jgi:hypothetical protein
MYRGLKRLATEAIVITKRLPLVIYLTVELTVHRISKYYQVRNLGINGLNSHQKGVALSGDIREKSA